MINKYLTIGSLKKSLEQGIISNLLISVDGSVTFYHSNGSCGQLITSQGATKFYKYQRSALKAFADFQPIVKVESLDEYQT